MIKRPKILFTSTLDEHQIQFAENEGLEINVSPLVETIPYFDQSAKEKIKNFIEKNIIAIFTSQSSLNFVLEHLGNNIPKWRIACTAPQTNEKARRFFGEHKIIATGNTASDLARHLINEDFKNDFFLFFSGADRKDDIPDMLEKFYPLQWDEIMVYKSIVKDVVINTNYDGVAFCSPSAVNAYFAKNKNTDETYFFAIGNSTASTLKEKGIKKIITSTIPDKNNMLKEIIKTFN